MTATNKQTAAIWAEKLGDAYVGCYGLLDDLDREKDGTEEEFRNKCRDYKAYINSHYALPSVSTEPELYGWMIRSKANYNSYVDHRRKYLTDLFNYILSLGFSI